MWYKIQRMILFRLKELENGLIAFSRKREIRHAYRGADRVKPALTSPRKPRQEFHFPRPSMRVLGSALTIAAIASIAAIVFVTGPAVLRKLSAMSSSISESITAVRIPQIHFPTIKFPKKAELSAPDASDLIPPSMTRAQSTSPYFPEGLDVPGPEVLAELSESADSLADSVSVDVRMSHMILANKALHRFYLLKKNASDSWSIEKEFFVATGETPGPKRINGDRKTPVGLYFVTGRKEKRELDAKYGPLCYILNYPNEYDRRMGYSGEGIWIHGTKPDTIPYKTLGCLELDNNDISLLGSILKQGIGTPVYVVDDSSMTDPVRYPDFARIERKRARILADYIADRNHILALVRNWENSWESREINGYINCYDQSFDGDGMKLSGWRERKARIFATQNSIRVDLGRIFVSEYAESTAVLKFSQDYSAGAMHTKNGKKLTVVKKDGTWRIYRETTIPEEEFAL